MAKVKVVNRQEIDGKVRDQGEVIEVSPGRARDLINDGKAVAVPAVEKVVETKGGK